MAIITGAGRGLGRATAEAFAREGATVILCSRTRRELHATCEAIAAAGGEAFGRVTDIASPREVRALTQLTFRRYGRLDLLINNAGVLGPRVCLADYPSRDWVRTIRINLTGTFYITQQVARIMAKQGHGSIISISSSVGRKGRAQWGAYAVAKFGVEGLMQVLADELRPFHVQALTFNPGGTRTRMRAEACPEEDPASVQPPSIPAEALVRLASCSSMDISGRAFDLHNLP